MSAPDGRLTECGWCRRRFAEDREQAACRSCPIGTGCRFVRCPHCGYENPARPAWLVRLQTWRAGREAR